MEDTLNVFLAKRKAANNFRTLKISAPNSIDFCSNDYLGFAQSDGLWQATQAEIERVRANPKYANKGLGSTGSRLLSGNALYTQEVEAYIAQYHQTETATIFATGYQANVGIYPTLARKNDTILYDELSHASTIDGIRLSPAQKISFKHNSLTDLEAKIKQLKPTNGRIFISIEALYSMDGDVPPLSDIVALAQLYNTGIIIDEAHSTGIIGEKGRGLSQHLQVQNNILARIHTYGKAMGTHGASICGSKILQQYLINFCRSFIYSTAPSLHQVASIKMAYQQLSHSQSLITQLQERIKYFRACMHSIAGINLLESHSPIQGIAMQNRGEIKALANYLQQHGFDVRPILPPTVPEGSERIRICLHTYNSTTEIKYFYQYVNKFVQNVQ